jgi:branched-subunit amino acid transport protein AzlD
LVFSNDIDAIRRTVEGTGFSVTQDVHASYYFRDVAKEYAFFVVAILVVACFANSDVVKGALWCGM